MPVHILRLSHRAARDKRVTTHLGMVARAFGSEKMIVTGLKDPHLYDSIKRVVDSWGGPFDLEFSPSWKQVIKEYKSQGYKIAHLTMYGIPCHEHMPKIKGIPNLLVVIGGEKVPGEVYEEADFNIAVTNQPHSEISALAVFLDRLLDSELLEKDFKGAKKRVVPQEKGKRVLDL
jgi:tRNA (cytidine56-2'-O)-methyltransferase